MPQYLSPTGRTVDAAAAFDGRRLKPGFREILGPGEALSFSLNMCDARPQTVSDQTSSDAQRKERSAYEQGVADQNAWRGLPQRTSDAKADYEATRKAVQDEIHNGWRRQSAAA